MQRICFGWSKGKGKGKGNGNVHPRTDHEGPERESRGIALLYF